MASRKVPPRRPARAPNPTSVTGVPCKCGFLDEAAKEPEIPIVFDAELREYHLLSIPKKGGGYTIVFHCPSCGGAAPRSRRPDMFAHVPRREHNRLLKITSGFATLEEVIVALGPPDRDFTAGLIVTTPASARKPPTTTSHRELLYGGISKTADVRFTDCGPNRGVRASFTGKYIGRPKT